MRHWTDDPAQRANDIAENMERHRPVDMCPTTWPQRVCDDYARVLRELIHEEPGNG